jgi:hypothetical protein
MYMAPDTSRSDALQIMFAYVEGPKVRNIKLERHFGLVSRALSQRHRPKGKRQRLKRHTPITTIDEQQ